MRDHPYRKCGHPSCDRPRQCGDYCRMHYARWKRTGTTQRQYRPQPAKCAVVDCNEFAVAKTYCRNHYARWHRTGTTELKPKPKAIRCEIGHYCPNPVHAKRLCATHYRADLRRRRAAGGQIRAVRPRWAA